MCSFLEWCHLLFSFVPPRSSGLSLLPFHSRFSTSSTSSSIHSCSFWAVSSIVPFLFAKETLSLFFQSLLFLRGECINVHSVWVLLSHFESETGFVQRALGFELSDLIGETAVVVVKRSGFLAPVSDGGRNILHH